MKLIKDIKKIADEDKALAFQLMTKLKAGNRVFGSPAEGLKQTLKKLEEKQVKLAASKGKLDWLDKDASILSQIAMVKAGINGEEQLAEYMERVVKYGENGLDDIITFASVSDPEQNNGGDEWISDSDFVMLHGDQLLIVDAKNIRTNPEIPIYLDGNDLVSVGGKPILELHPSVHIWRKIFDKNGLSEDVADIHGCVVIVNGSGATVWKNKTWYQSEVKPMHISELVEFLTAWMDNRPAETSLAVVTAIAKMQIHKERNVDQDLSAVRIKFGI